MGSEHIFESTVIFFSLVEVHLRIIFFSYLVKKYFSVRVVRHWHRSPRNASSLEIFKDQLDRTLSNLVQWKVYLSMATGLEPEDLSGLFQPKQFYDSVTFFFFPREKKIWNSQWLFFVSLMTCCYIKRILIEQKKTWQFKN